MIGALELGGSHISSALVDLDGPRVEGLLRSSLDPDADLQELLGVLGESADRVRHLRPVGFAVPGPFDYDRGICLIRGLGKLEALYRVDIGAALRLDARFVNDAEAFLLGEARAGAARGHERSIGITLGTGLGSAFLAGGQIVRDGAGVPPGGELHRVPFRGVPVEDVLSGRGIRAAGGGATDAAALCARADEGDREAAAVFARFGEDLAEFLQPWVEAFRPTVVVVGGGITGAWQHFRDSLPPIALPARLTGASALLGAAVWAADDRSNSCAPTGFFPRRDDSGRRSRG